MPVVARVEPLGTAPKDRRRTPRMQLILGAVVGEHGSSARIHDISTKGLLFETSAALPDDLVQVNLPEANPTHARIAWRHGRFFGCEFVEPLPAASVSAALLQSDHPARLAAHATVEAGIAAARPGHGWLKATLAAALAVACAAYLVETGHVVLLMGIAVALAAIAAVMVWAVNWGLDNTRSF
jgi:hypothetical protein